jgi:hypothetical protein
MAELPKLRRELVVRHMAGGTPFLHGAAPAAAAAACGAANEAATRPLHALRALEGQTAASVTATIF